MITPIRVRIERSLLVTNDLKAMNMPSRKFMVYDSWKLHLGELIRPVPWRTSGFSLLIAQGDDGIQPGGAIGRIYAEDKSYRDREREAQHYPED
jgi:hypothetical protein